MAREQTWKAAAACRDLDVEMFFPASEAEEDVAPAKAVCAVCPVRQQCLDYAIETRQEDGVWGGLTETERRRERRRRRTARPRAA